VFGTLLGGLPRPPDDADARAAAVAAQEAAGLEPITDGRLARASAFHVGADAWSGWARPLTVEGWRATAALTNQAVKQALPGPYTLSRALRGGRKARESRAIAMAEGLREEVLALAVAGCPLVEIEETEAHRIGEDETERRLFAAAHRRLAEGVAGTHLSLSIVGGSAWDAGPETILGAPYASLAVDLIAGPDNWNLVVRAPGDRGIVAGALSPELGSDDAPELLLWAASYAASTGGRGLARVGLGIAGSLAALTWEQALAKLERLARGVEIAAMPPGEQKAAAVDPRAINIRSAAYGQPVPERPERSRPRGPRP
jgi:methionine synthase II (cobalamin-independent)